MAVTTISKPKYQSIKIWAKMINATAKPYWRRARTSTSKIAPAINTTVETSKLPSTPPSNTAIVIVKNGKITEPNNKIILRSSAAFSPITSFFITTTSPYRDRKLYFEYDAATTELTHSSQ